VNRWREQALAGLDAGLCGDKTDPAELRLAEAHKRLDEALIENELVRERCRRQRTFGPGDVEKMSARTTCSCPVAALEPLAMALEGTRGSASAEVARGPSLRLDHGGR
jgi:hypothetical protein